MKLFHGGDPYHIDTSPLICRANQQTSFCIMGTSIMKEFTKDENNTNQLYFSKGSGLAL